MMFWGLDKRGCADLFKSVILFAVASLGLYLFIGETDASLGFIKKHFIFIYCYYFFVLKAIESS